LLYCRPVVSSALGPIDRVIPEIRRVTQTKQLDRLFRDASLCKIIACDLSGGFVGKGRLPALGDLLVHLHEGIFDMSRLTVCWTGFRFQNYMSTLGQATDRIHEADIFVITHESKNIAAFMTPE